MQLNLAIDTIATFFKEYIVESGADTPSDEITWSHQYQGRDRRQQRSTRRNPPECKS